MISPEAEGHPRADEISARFPDAQIIRENEKIKGVPERETGTDKKTLRLDVFKGRFLKPCPCSCGVLSCGYLVLSPVVGCPFSCSYCVLKEYLNAPAITAYVNLEELFNQVETFLDDHPGRSLRIGTGELADSLALEPELGFAAPLVEFFSNKPNAIFELKTKSCRIQGILNIEHGGRTVIGFSLNAEEAAETEEPDAPNLSERIEAAEKAVEAGYQVAFHFAPIIDLDPLADPSHSVLPYREVVDRIYDSVSEKKIAWISLGALRFNKALFRRLREESPGRRLLLGEFFPGFDGKIRYLRHRRRGLLSRLSSMIRSRDPRAPLYLCMEDARMVERVLGSRKPPFQGPI